MLQGIAKVLCLMIIAALAVGLSAAAETAEAPPADDATQPGEATCDQNWEQAVAEKLELGEIVALKPEPEGGFAFCNVGTCGSCRNQSGQHVLCMPGTSTIVNTGFKRCVLPDGNLIGCGGGQTIFVEKFACPRGGCMTRCTGPGQMLASPACR